MWDTLKAVAGIYLFGPIFLGFGVNSCVRAGSQGIVEYYVFGPPPGTPMMSWTPAEREDALLKHLARIFRAADVVDDGT